MWVAKPGDRIVVIRTAVLSSKKLSRRGFRALEEAMYIYILRCLERCFRLSPRWLLIITDIPLFGVALSLDPQGF